MKNGDHHMPPDFNNRADLSVRLKESLPMEVQTLGYTFHPTGGKFFPMFNHGLFLRTKDSFARI